MPFSKMRTLFRLQRTIIGLLLVSFLCGMVLGISLVTNTDLGSGVLSLFRAEKQGPLEHITHPVNKQVATDGSQNQLSNHIPRRFRHFGNGSNNAIFSADRVAKLRDQVSVKQVQRKSISKHKVSARIMDVDDDKFSGAAENFSSPCYNAHIFYYPWYGNPSFDNGKWLHWNHEYLPHWNKVESRKWPKGIHNPPHDIGSNYYPQLGPYSSRDPKVMSEHMKQIRSTGVGVLSVSWYPPGQADQQGDSWDEFLPELMDVAHRYQLKVCLHIEPYKNRSAEVFREHLKYINTRYNSHPAFYKYNHRGKLLPLFYIYDSYLVKAKEWASIFREEGSNTVRNTDIDGVFIGLLVEEKHTQELASAGFDGFFTYFASDGFTYGSSTRNWGHLSSFALVNNLLFIPSVGPGYIDVRVRPWNAANTKDRERGGYFEQSFKAALISRPPFISITSFNEWHEGTQIEKAVPKSLTDFVYADYSPQPPNYYLILARKWVRKFKLLTTNQTN